MYEIVVLSLYMCVFECNSHMFNVIFTWHIHKCHNDRIFVKRETIPEDHLCGKREVGRWRYVGLVGVHLGAQVKLSRTI